MKIDFLITRKGKSYGYVSTNMACPIYGYKRRSSIGELLASLSEMGVDFTFATNIPVADDRKRPLTRADSRLHRALGSQLAVSAKRGFFNKPYEQEHKLITRIIRDKQR